MAFKDSDIPNALSNMEVSTTVNHKISLQCIHFGFFTFSSCKNNFFFNYTDIPLLFHIVPAKTKAFKITCNEIFCSSIRFS